MDHYIDITLKPDAEMRKNVLLNKVYTKFHKALFDSKIESIGVSFPQYKILLGKVLRVHGDATVLNELQNLNWLGRLSGYCNISEIIQVPSNCKYRIVSRKQSNMTQSKLNRLVKRGSISSAEAKTYKVKMYSLSLDNPYLELESGSNGHMHRRFIQFSSFMNESIAGKFDTFGLSKQATVPWF